MNEATIIESSLRRLKELTQINGKWKPLAKEIDGKIDFEISQKKTSVFVEVKKELREYQLQNIIKTAKQYHPLMVVAERIFPTLKEALREHNIGYLDTAGNIYLNTDGNIIWLDGNKHEVQQKPVTNRAFTKSGLQTVFHLLLNKENIKMPYRAIAKASDVALGSIKNIIEGLKEAGFILKVTEKNIQLQNKKALLDRWIAGYRETLKPALLIGKFRFWKEENLLNWQTLPLDPSIAKWGGEPAAEHFTNYLRPETLTVYTTEERAKIMSAWTLIPDNKGNVSLYQKFWNDGDAAMQQDLFAPPLLVYADLMITDDPRCIETAQIIYNQYLKNEFE